MPRKAANAADISSNVTVNVRDLSVRRSISGLPDFCKRSWYATNAPATNSSRPMST